MRKNRLKQWLTLLLLYANALVMWGQIPAAFFSTTFDEANRQNKWYVIRSLRTGNQSKEHYGWRVKSNNTIGTAPINTIDDNALWCFVGDANNFKIYNKQLGEARVAMSDGAAFTEAAAVKMLETASVSAHWVLGQNFANAEANAGYTFHVSADNTKQRSPNAYGGVGNDVKFYSTDDLGSRWVVEQPAFVLTDFLSESYNNAKWVRIHWSNPKDGLNVGWTLRNNNTTNYNGRRITVSKIDFADSHSLWCFVKEPNSQSFKIYNKQAGPDHPVKTDNAGNLELGTSSTARTWSFGTAYLAGTTDHPGLVFYPNGVNDRSPNLYAGTLGYNVALYNHADNGSHWFVRDAGLAATFQKSIAGDVQSGDVNKPLQVDITNGPVGFSLSLDANQTTIYLSRNISTTFALSPNVNYRNVTLNAGDGGSANTLSYAKILESDKTFTVNATWYGEAGYIFKNPGRVGNSSHPYREPAIAVAPNGDVLAFADFRRNNGDIGRNSGVIDIMARVKSAGGDWGQISTVVAGNGEDANTKGYSSPAVTADHTENKVLLMTQTGNRNWDNTTVNAELNSVMRVARIVYVKEAENWARQSVEDKTQHFYQLFSGVTGLKGLSFPSGRLLQSKVVKQGSHYRVYGVIYAKITNNNNRVVYVVYSDDFGQTWNRLGNDAALANGVATDSKLAETPEGNIVLVARSSAGVKFNVFTFSDINNDQTAGTWGGVQNGNGTGNTDPRNGDVMLVRARKSDNTPVVLALRTAATTATPGNVKVYYKEVGGNITSTEIAGGWGNGYSLSTTTSQNATMDLQCDGKVGFLYEETLVSNGYDIVYQALDLNTITGGAYTFDREVAAATATEVLKQCDFVGGYTTTEAANVAIAKDGFMAGEVLLRTLDVTVGNLKKTGTPIPFAPNKYYRLYNAYNQVVATDYNGGIVAEDEDATKVSQFWKVSAIDANAMVTNPNEPQVGATNIAVTSTDGINFSMNLRSNGEASYRLKPIATVGVKVLAGRIYGTFYYPFAVSITDQTDATFYKSVANQPDRVLTTSVSGSVNKETPVIVKAANSNDAADQVFRLAIDYSNTQANLNDVNLVQGVLVPTPKSAGSIYIMAKASRGEGFYKTTADGVLAANKAFLNATAGTTRASFLPFADGEEPTTGIGGVIADGRVVKYYNLNGTPVAKLVSGVMYITSDGKKVIFK